MRKQIKKTVKLKDIFSRYHSSFDNIEDLLANIQNLHEGHEGHPYNNSKNRTYDWESLMTSIQQDGLQNPIICDIDEDDRPEKYSIFDGEHRYLVLKSLYGTDYEVEIIVNLFFKFDIRKD